MTDQSRDEREAKAYAETLNIVPFPDSLDLFKAVKRAYVIALNVERARRASEPQGHRWEIWVNGEGQVVRDQRFAQPTDRKVIVREVPKPQPPASEHANKHASDMPIADDRSQASDEAFEKAAGAEAMDRYMYTFSPIPPEAKERYQLRHDAFVQGALYGRRKSAAEIGRLRDLIYGEDGYIASQREQSAEIERLKNAMRDALKDDNWQEPLCEALEEK